MHEIVLGMVFLKIMLSMCDIKIWEFSQNVTKHRNLGKSSWSNVELNLLKLFDCYKITVSNEAFWDTQYFWNVML